MRFTVPLVPPSVNMYVRHTVKGQHYVTREAAKFKEAVAIFGRDKAIFAKSYEVEATVFLGKGKRGDADNFGKVLLDSLAACGCIRSDAYVEKFTIIKKRDAANPRTEITVTSLQVNTSADVKRIGGFP